MDSVAKKVFDIDGVLVCVFSYLVGTDLDDVMKNRNIRATSTQFNKCFMKYLKSSPLEYHHVQRWASGEGSSRKEIATARWMKTNNVSLHKLGVFVGDNQLGNIYRQLIGLDFGRLNEIGVKIVANGDTNWDERNWESFSNDQDERDWESFWSLFKEAVPLTCLRMDNDHLSLERNYLSSFPNLKELHLENCNHYDIREINNVESNFAGELTLRYNFGDLAVESRKIRVLNVVVPYADVGKINCPLLEKFVCIVDIDEPVTIGGISSSIIRDKCEDRHEFLKAKHWNEVNHDLDVFSGVAVVPPSFMGNDSFSVGDSCSVVFIFGSYC